MAEERSGASYGIFQPLDEIFVHSLLYVAACVVNRPGYNSRYEEYGNTDRWHLCRSAYYILVERVVKHAIREGCRLRVLVEATGRKEDAKVREYHGELLSSGAPFDPERSSAYEPLTSADFRNVLLKNPKFVTKKNAVLQLADLMLYPAVAMGGCACRAKKSAPSGGAHGICDSCYFLDNAQLLANEVTYDLIKSWS